jgi:hypothetical protein
LSRTRKAGQTQEENQVTLGWVQNRIGPESFLKGRNFRVSALACYTVFGFQFSVKRLLIIHKLTNRFVAAETEFGIIPIGNQKTIFVILSAAKNLSL